MAHSIRGRRPPILAIAVLASVFCPPLGAQEAPRADPAAQGEQFADLSGMSLEELLDVEVSLVSRRAQRLGDAPASVHVITRKDIEQSGLTSIPELLRLVPGVHVQRIHAGRWAIGTRGQAGQFTNNLLVLMDGRSVYTPLFSGVYWDMQDLVLDDIERIEVTRGPGGSRWGANAVNGVINVVTRKAGDTQGTRFESVLGTEERAITSFRHGAALGNGTDLRISGKYRQQEATRTADDAPAGDGYSSALVGFRLDREVDEGVRWTLLGGLATLDEDSRELAIVAADPFMVPAMATTLGRSGHLLARGEFTGDDGAATRVQLYYDAFDRDWQGFYRERRHTADLDAQHVFAPIGDHVITVGAGYRVTRDHTDGSSAVRSAEFVATNDLLNVFALDDWTLYDGLRASVGVKLEHNDYTGLETQPEARLAWQPAADWLVWGAVSRAVRTPSRFEDAGEVDYAGTAGGPGGLPIVTTLFGNKDLAAEELLAYEVGTRGRIGQSLVGELNLFVHEYDDIVTLEPGTPFAGNTPWPRVVVPVYMRNAREFRNSGIEAALTWQPNDSWQLVGGYSYLDQHLESSGAPGGISLNYGRQPRHQAIVRANYCGIANWEIGAQAFYYGQFEEQPVDDFVRLDFMLWWRPGSDTRFGIVAQNLLDDRHPENSYDSLTVPTELERAVYLSFSHRF
ncbi:MAG: TonB-dependent receptor [Planctomycetes bacterium]|nr:TonB-dependent receptor [Planctomycetota bacterium]